MSSDPPPETASIPESESTLSSRIDTPFADSVSSSSTLPEPISTTWQTQLNEARLGIARKVQQQQDEDGWEFPELEEEESELGENSGGDEPKGRRQSVVTTDGEDDEIVAELLRPGTSRANSQRDYSGKEEGSDPSIAEDGGDGREDGKAEERDMSNDRTCRICFDGEDDDLGKLFSPCRCRGTSRFVHTECLAAWRKASANSSSFYRCETCAFEYKFRRTFVGNVINSRFSVLTFTAFTFLILVWGSGFLANSLLSMVESRAHSLHGTVFDDFFVADHVLLGEGVRESLAFVTHQLEDSRWSSAREIAQQAHLQDPLEGDGSMYRWFGKSGKAAATIPTTQSGLADPGLWARAVLHMTKGISLLGLLSVFYTYIAATFVSPLGRTLFRAIRPAGGRRRAGDNSTSFSQIIIILVIAVGIARAMRQVYRGVRWSCRRALSRIEDLVIEVN